MMNKMIIKYADNVPIDDVLLYVQKVIEAGRISGDGKCYCYITTFKDDTVCAAELTKTNTDKFSVWRKQ